MILFFQILRRMEAKIPTPISDCKIKFQMLKKQARQPAQYYIKLLAAG
jgi:hypothetical protein